MLHLLHPPSKTTCPPPDRSQKLVCVSLIHLSTHSRVETLRTCCIVLADGQREHGAR